MVNSQKEEIQLQHSEITDSINYAKRIQDAMINKQSEWDKIGSKRFIFFRPKDVVSGDFYWAHNMDNISIWAVADCTGHGVPGAFMSMLGFGFLNEIVIEGVVTNAAEILNRLRSKIIAALGEKDENQARTVWTYRFAYGIRTPINCNIQVLTIRFGSFATTVLKNLKT